MEPSATRDPAGWTSDIGAPPLPPIANPIALSPPLAEWPEDYKKRRSELRRGVVKLDSGRSVAFTDDGDETASKVVVCIHGMCQSKALWLLKAPLDAVRQISIDRFGYGNSSGDGAGDVKDDWLTPPSSHFLMDEQSLEYVEFLDKMQIDKCYVIGHSMGTMVAQALAMQLDQKQRLLGIALMGASPHPRHNKIKDDAEWLKLTTTDGTTQTKLDTALSFSEPGCCCSGKWLVESMVASQLTFTDRTTKDPDFAGLYTEMMRGEDGGSDEANAAMDKDAFVVASSLEAYLYGQNYNAVMPCDLFRGLGTTWGDLDDGTITAPVLVYMGEVDQTMRVNQIPFFTKLYPQAKIEVLKGHGHCTMFLELERIMRELVQL
jgi:pimeloyl-ACP methyl ester carboxylesterase